MLKTEWKFGSDCWIPYHVSKLKWLVVHQLDHNIINNWSDEDASDSDEEVFGVCQNVWPNFKMLKDLPSGSKYG
jgi:hypothetical protein